MRAQHHLCRLYDAWLTVQSLPKASADELLMQPDLNQAQRSWLWRFYDLWDRHV